jgi:hypothetical protein
MRKDGLDPRILKKLKEKLQRKVAEDSIRPSISKIRREYPSLTLNGAAEVFAQKHRESIQKYLNYKDRDSLKTVTIEKVKIPSSKPRRAKEIITIARYDTDDKWLNSHLNEINKTYTYGCYTATFILCRKVLENLIIHHILKKKYPTHSQHDREKYFDVRVKKRFHDFAVLLSNLRDSANDFNSENKIVERVCELADGFKETANEMTHSLYHIARKSEVDGKGFQGILDLISELEKSIT